MKYWILKTDDEGNIHDLIGSMLFEISKEDVEKLKKKRLK